MIQTTFPSYINQLHSNHPLIVSTFTLKINCHPISPQLEVLDNPKILILIKIAIPTIKPLIKMVITILILGHQLPCWSQIHDFPTAPQATGLIFFFWWISLYIFPVNIASPSSPLNLFGPHTLDILQVLKLSVNFCGKFHWYMFEIF